MWTVFGKLHRINDTKIMSSLHQQIYKQTEVKSCRTKYKMRREKWATTELGVKENSGKTRRGEKLFWGVENRKMLNLLKNNCLGNYRNKKSVKFRYLLSCILIEIEFLYQTSIYLHKLSDGIRRWKTFPSLVLTGFWLEGVKKFYSKCEGKSSQEGKFS